MGGVLQQAETYVIDSFPQFFRAENDVRCPTGIHDLVSKLLKVVFPDKDFFSSSAYRQASDPDLSEWWFITLCLMSISRHFNLDRITKRIHYLFSQSGSLSPLFSLGAADVHRRIKRRKWPRYLKTERAGYWPFSTVKQSDPFKCLSPEDQLVVAESFINILQHESTGFGDIE